MAIIDKHSSVTVRVRGKNGHDVEPVAVIDLDEFQEARHDPRWRAFAKDAKQYRDKLRQEGCSV